MKEHLENIAIADAQPNGYQRNMRRGYARSGRFEVECVPNAWGDLNYKYRIDGQLVSATEFRKATQ